MKGPPLLELPLAQFLTNGFRPYQQYLKSYSPVASFLDAADSLLQRLLSFYNPSLAPAQRVSANWPLMRPSEVVIIILTYLFFVLCVSIGRALFGRSSSNTSAPSQQRQQQQEERARSNARNGYNHAFFRKMGFFLILQVLYNALQIMICSYIVYRTLAVYVAEGYSLAFNKFDSSRTSMAEIVWLFYLTKVLDLADTVLIVCRGKWNQFSFLHVYHHASIIYMTWINASVAYDGDIYFAVLANAFIHVIMYSYYLLASLSMGVASKVKPLVTRAQMAQFLAMLFQAFYHFCFFSQCHYPFRVAVGYVIYIISMYVLFANFSKKTYGEKKFVTATCSLYGRPTQSHSSVYTSQTPHSKKTH